MRMAGRLASEVLDMLTPHVQPGITTNELDRLAHDYIVDVQGAIPAHARLRSRPATRPTPSRCAPRSTTRSATASRTTSRSSDGDIVNIDVTVIKDGWHGDTSRMFVVGEGSIAAKRLCQLTYEAMWHGIAKVKPGARLGDIGHAIQTFAESARLLGGARVLRPRHRPRVSTRSRRCCTTAARHAGELGARHDLHHRAHDQRRPARDRSRAPDDGWTIVTKDRSLSAQWEHTVLVTDTGYEVLTLSAGSPPPPAFVPTGPRMSAPADLRRR
jgi:methionyl aminopeptidase